MWYPPAIRPVLAVLLMLTVVVVVVFFTPTSYARRWGRGVVGACWFFVFGLGWQVVRDPLARSTHLAVDGELEVERIVRLTAMNGIGEKVVRADAEVLAILSSGEVCTRSGSLMITLLRTPGMANPVAGDELLLRSRVLPITRIPDPGGFDRRAWAASRGMYHETFAGSGQWAVVGHHWQWTDLFEPTRQRIAGWLAQSDLAPREQALAKALVLGLRDELDHEQKDAFVKSGTVHILAVSGSHVGFIYVMLVFLLGWWGGGRRVRALRGVIILLALWGYAGLTGACPSVLRATIMFSLFTVSGFTGRRNEPLNSLFTAAFLLVLWNPHMLVELGFLLSFLAVLGIILFYGPLLHVWVPSSRILAHCWSLTAVSLAAQVFTTPLSLYFFKAFPIWFLPANVVVVFVAGIAVWGAVALLAVVHIPVLGDIWAWCLSLLLVVVDRVTGFFAGVPGAYPAVRITSLDMVLLYMLILFLAVWVFWRRRAVLWMAWSSLGLLLLGWGHQARQCQQRVTFTVYDDRRALQAAMSVGRELVTLLPDTNGHSSWLSNKTERHVRAFGLESAEVIDHAMLFGFRSTAAGHTHCGGGGWIAPGLVVHFHHGRSGPASMGAAEVLVLHDLRYLKKDDLERLATESRQVVLAGGLPWKLRAYVSQWCREHQVPCHDVRTHGAFYAERMIPSGG